MLAGSINAKAQSDYTPDPTTTVEVDNTVDLAAFIASDQVFDGDTVLLVSDSYVVTDTIKISKNITIFGDPRLETRPVLSFEGTGIAFQPISGGLSMKFNGFDMQGIWTDDMGAEKRASILEYGRTNEFGAELIDFRNVHATGFRTGIELYYNQSQIYEKIVIRDVIWGDITGWIFDPRINAIKDVDILFSTFYTFGGFLKNPSFEKVAADGTVEREKVLQNILIDHNTFFNGLTGQNTLIQINDPKDNSVTLIFSNNIVSTLQETENTRPIRINELAGTFSFQNNLFFNFEGARDAGKFGLQQTAEAQANVISENNIFDQDPAFVDAANANFALPENSPLLAVSTTGGVIGDPEWVGQEDDGSSNPGGGMVSEIRISAPGSQNTITSKGGFIDLAATVLPADAADRTITWSVSDESIATVNQNGSVSALANGTVTVTATANDGSGVVGTYEITITGQATGIKPWEAEIADVYPNPATEVININSTSKVKVTISTLSGQVVRSGNVNGTGTFSVAGLQKGLYVVLVKSGTKVQSLKLIIE